MYYTEIEFNLNQRRAIIILDDAYKQHSCIMSGFKKYNKDDLGRVLYRIEPPTNGRLVTIVQSIVPPTYEVNSIYRGVIMATKTKEVLFTGQSEPAFNDGMTFRFRLRANAVVTKAGKRIGLIREEALREWFEKRAAGIGIGLYGYDVVDEGYIRGNKDGKDMMFKIARYDGVLMIRDREKFTATFINGFGHAKGFGCGLISLARS